MRNQTFNKRRFNKVAKYYYLPSIYKCDVFVSFTLIELLIVVAIIAVLVSILLPALSEARKSAQQIACSTNLHEMSYGVQLYMNDYNDCFPPYRTYLSPTTSRMWPHIMFALKYIHETKIYACPGFNADKSSTKFLTEVPGDLTLHQWIPSNIFYYVHYGINFAYIGGCIHWVPQPTQYASISYSVPARLPMVEKPTRTIMFGDSYDYRALVFNNIYRGCYKLMDEFHPNWNYRYDIAHPIHRKGINILYCDLHVGYIQGRTDPYNQTDTNNIYNFLGNRSNPPIEGNSDSLWDLK